MPEPKPPFIQPVPNYVFLIAIAALLLIVFGALIWWVLIPLGFVVLLAADVLLYKWNKKAPKFKRNTPLIFNERKLP